jgi:hypothetical protein
MAEMTPKFPVTIYSRVGSSLPWGKPHVEEDIVQSVQELQEDLEWIDTRVDDRIWLVDADGTRFDVKLNWLMGEEVQFFPHEG